MTVVEPGMRIVIIPQHVPSLDGGTVFTALAKAMPDGSLFLGLPADNDPDGDWLVETLNDATARTFAAQLAKLPPAEPRPDVPGAPPASGDESDSVAAPPLGPFEVSALVPFLIVEQVGGGDVVNVANVMLPYDSIPGDPARQRAMAIARLFAAAPELLALAWQYRSDLLHPPAPDSRERRIAAIDTVLAGAAPSAARPARPRTCRFCGCTDDRACVTDGEACHWISADICSACESIRFARGQA